MNPIENVWHEMKCYVRRQRPTTKQELVDAIRNFWNTMTAQKCSKYIDHLHKLLHNHNVFERSRQLSSITDPTTAQKIAEALDRDITRSMIASEKRLKRHSTTPFSSALAQACLAVVVLKLHLKKITFNKI